MGKAMRTEIFYGIRIGDPRRHKTYLKLEGWDNRVQLFDRKDEAERECESYKYGKENWKVVKVKVYYAG